MYFKERDWSGKRDSNSRPQPWQGADHALPTGCGSECFEILDVCTSRRDIGAGNETRTRDPDLGKVVLYQLSYSRNRMSFASDWSGKRDSNSRPRPWQGRALPTELFPQRNITYTYLVKLFGAGNEIQTRDPSLGKHRSCSTNLATPAKRIGAGNETRTRDPDLGKVVLYQLSYSRNRLSLANNLERETRLELATPTLARSCSTN